MKSEFDLLREDVFSKIEKIELNKVASVAPDVTPVSIGEEKIASSETDLLDMMDAMIKKAEADETGSFTEGSQTSSNDDGESQNAKHTHDKDNTAHDAPLAPDSEGGEGLDSAADGMKQTVTKNDNGESQNSKTSKGEGDTAARTMSVEGDKLAETSSNAKSEDGADSIAKADLTQDLKEGKSPQGKGESTSKNPEKADGPTDSDVDKSDGPSTSDRTMKVEDNEKLAASDSDDDDDDDDDDDSDVSESKRDSEDDATSEQSSDDGEDVDKKKDSSAGEMPAKMSKEAQALTTDLIDIYLENVGADMDHEKLAGLRRAGEAELDSAYEKTASEGASLFQDILFL